MFNWDIETKPWWIWQCFVIESAVFLTGCCTTMGEHEEILFGRDWDVESEWFLYFFCDQFECSICIFLYGGFILHFEFAFFFAKISVFFFFIVFCKILANIAKHIVFFLFPSFAVDFACFAKQMHIFCKMFQIFYKMFTIFSQISKFFQLSQRLYREIDLQNMQKQKCFFEFCRHFCLCCIFL